MSKKTKRLEKENLTLTRKHDLTNRNILEMAEERTKTNQDLEVARKRNEKLTDIINQMQKQGRGLASGMAGVVEESMEGEYVEGEGDPEGTDESDYYDEEGSEEGAYDEDTEEDIQHQTSQPFGPVPPPPPPQAVANGITANGVSH